jgi:hypothetical protein
LNRGETARASVAFNAVLMEFPGQPEAHWFLALLDRQRGRYESAAVHLEAFWQRLEMISNPGVSLRSGAWRDWWMKRISQTPSRRIPGKLGRRWRTNTFV